MNVTPNAADQIELINDDLVNSWLRLSQYTTLTVACFLHRAAVNPRDEGNPVRPNTPRVGHYRNYLTRSQFDVSEFYTEPESNSELEEDIGRPPKRRRAFSRSHNGWQKRILSNDHKGVRLQNHFRELSSRPRVRQGEAYMGRYAGQNFPSVALPPGIPPPRCEALLVDAMWRVTTWPVETPQTRRTTIITVTRILFVPGNVFFWLTGVFFLLFHGLSLFLLSFLLIASGLRGFYALFVPGGVFLGFRVGFLLFHRFFLVCFPLVSINLQGFLRSVFVPGSVCFEPLGSSFVSRAFFFASLLLCFFASLLHFFFASLLLYFFASPLLCFFLLITLLILCAVLYSFPISYLSLRFSCF